MNKFDIDNLIAYLPYVAVGLFGAIASYLHSLSKGLEFTILSMISYIVVSSFGGLLMLLLCLYFNVDPILTGAICGLSGWSGARVVEELEKKMLDKVKQGKQK